MRQGRGFTIVELLVVVVVIGLLAAIAIASYNGVRKTAIEGATKSGLETTAKKVALYQAENGSYPAELWDANLKSSGGSGSTSYQYTHSSDQDYCLSATTGGVSYQITQNGVMTGGVCSAQVSSGEVTNLVPNPSFETSTVGWGGYYGGGYARSTEWASSGSYSIKHTRSLPDVLQGPAYSTNSRTGNVAPNATPLWARYYTVTFVAMSPTNQTIAVAGRGFLTNPEGWWEDTTTMTMISLVANQPQRVTLVFALPENRQPVTTSYDGGFGFKVCSIVGTPMGTSFYIDDVAMYLGARDGITYTGNSAGWHWTGTPNESFSTGSW